MPQILPVPNPTPSYWLSEPHKHSKLRSTADLPSECDIAIIGSGMSGIVTAYHILQESDSANLPNVVILEARDLCSGATARNGGHSKIKINTLTGWLGKIDPEGIKEAIEYVHRIASGLKRIVEEEELNCEFEIRRTMDVFLDADEAEAVRSLYEKSRKAGEEWAKRFHWVPTEHIEQVTSIKGAVAAASSPVASFWPYKFVTQLLARMVERYPAPTLNAQTNTPVTSVVVVDGLNVLTTPRGVLKAKKVVFATNAYTAGLLPQFKDVIVPVRGTASHITPSHPIHPHLSTTYNLNHGPEKSVDYLNPRPDSSIVVGGAGHLFRSNRALWFDNFDDSTHLPPVVDAYWTDYMQRNFLGWEDSGAETESVWTGIMGVTPDGWAHVGRVPGSEKQWICAGFNGGGMATILTAARGVARMASRDLGFEEVRGECGLLGVMGTGWDRLTRAVEGSKEERKGDCSPGETRS